MGGSCPRITERPLRHCGKGNMERLLWPTSHQLFSVIQVILHLGPLGCTGEHTLHYLDGQSLRNPSVFGPAVAHRSKNITSAMCDFLCHINGTSRYVHLSLKPCFNVKVAKGYMSVLCARDDSCCRFPWEVS